MLSIFTSIAYKEMIKTRFIALCLFIFNLCALFWVFLSIRKLFMLDHSEVVWYRVMDLGQIPYQSFVFIPLITAIIFCVFQFLLEMRDARIRISLHLPYDSSTLVLLHALVGLLFLSVLFIFDLIALCAILDIYFPKELSTSAVITSLPWFLSALFAYLGGAFVLLEPQIKRKSLGVFIAFTLCVQLLIYTGVAYYMNILALYVVLLLCILYTIPVSADDYRNRWM